MQIEVLNQKPILVDTAGNQYLDLSYNSYNISNFNSVIAIEVVSAENEMRLDKIALKYYGDTKYLDLLCKANNIFNPFSIMEGDILIIPNIPKQNTIYKNKGIIVERTIRENYVDSARLSTKDQTRIQRIKDKNKSLSNASSTPLPPNILKEGEANKVYKDGGIILGKQNTL